MTALITTDSLADQVRVFLADAPELARELWDAVATRVPTEGGVADLLAAARAGDGGKYVRPRLVATAFFSYGGEDVELLRRVAGAQQLLHIGLCLHDDLIDGDRVRHGRANVAASVEASGREIGLDDAMAARRGTAAGILAGDLAINTAIAALIAAPVPAEVRLGLATAATRALERTIAGEVLDVWSEAEAPRDADPLLVARLKTAAYSVVLPLQLGAIAAGAGDDETLASIAAVGEPFGIAYQLSDDDLGLFGDPAVTGKDRLSDLRDGKRTELMRATLAVASSEDSAVLLAALGDAGLTEETAARVRGIVEACGARGAVSRTIDDLLAQALATAHAELPEPLAQSLAALTQRLRARDR